MSTVTLLTCCSTGSSDHTIKQEEAMDGGRKGEVGLHLLSDDMIVYEEHPKENCLKVKRQIFPKMGQ